MAPGMQRQSCCPLRASQPVTSKLHHGVASAGVGEHREHPGNREGAEPACLHRVIKECH